VQRKKKKVNLSFLRIWNVVTFLELQQAWDTHRIVTPTEALFDQR